MAKKSSESTAAKIRKRLSPEEKAEKALKIIEKQKRVLLTCNAMPAIKMAQNCIKNLKSGDRVAADECAHNLVTVIGEMK